MVYGYARVANNTNSLNALARLFRTIDIAPDNMFLDSINVRNTNREQYFLLKRHLRKGDLLYLDALDSLGNNYTDILREWIDITRALGADIVALEQESLFDSRKFHPEAESGSLLETQFISMLTYIAATERRYIVKRQTTGRIEAIQNGHRLGRKKKEAAPDIDVIVERWLAGKISSSEAVALSGLSRSVFYNRYGIRKSRVDASTDFPEDA